MQRQERAIIEKNLLNIDDKIIEKYQAVSYDYIKARNDFKRIHSDNKKRETELMESQHEKPKIINEISTNAVTEQQNHIVDVVNFEDIFGLRVTPPERMEDGNFCYTIHLTNAHYVKLGIDKHNRYFLVDIVPAPLKMVDIKDFLHTTQDVNGLLAILRERLSHISSINQ